MSRSCPYIIDPSGRDLHGEAERLRAGGRLTEVELPGQVRAWWVTDQALIKQLLTDRRVSRDTHQHWPAWEGGESEFARTWSLAPWVADHNMITAYGAEHTRLRRLVSKAFTVRLTNAMRPRVESIVAGLLDRIGDRPAGAVVDLRAMFAVRLPVQVISDLLGIPDEIRGDLMRVVNTILDTAISPQDAHVNVRELGRLIDELVAIKRDRPGDDLMTGLLQAVDEDGESRLTEQEVGDTVSLMFAAGHETTANLLDQAIHALLTHPDQLELVRGGSVGWEDVIEETLRLEAPFFNILLRYAVEEIDVGEVLIRRGEPIVIAFGAAGRDPRVHGAAADRFDVRRSTRRDHLAFGHGVHHCPGAPLARLQAAVGLPALFDRFPDLVLAQGTDVLIPVESFIANGHRTLPVRLA